MQKALLLYTWKGILRVEITNHFDFDSSGGYALEKPLSTAKHSTLNDLGQLVGAQTDYKECIEY